MAITDDALAWNAARGFTDWAALTATRQSQLLLQAQDYIQSRYQVRSQLSADQQARLSSATFILAREFATNPPALRQDQAVKELKEQVGPLVTDTTYFSAVTDAYPAVTGLLAPLLLGSDASAWNGRLVVLARAGTPAATTPATTTPTNGLAFDASRPANGAIFAMM